MTEFLDNDPSKERRDTWLKWTLHSALWLLPVIALTAASLLGYLGRDSWELDSFNHFRQQYLLMGGVLCLALLHCRRPVLFTIALATVMLNAWEVINLPQKTPEHIGRIYKALSSNVHTHNQDMNSLVALLRREQPDFAAIIELTSDWKPVLESLRDIYPHRELRLYGDHYGYCLLSRHPFTAEQPPFHEYGAMPRRVETPDGPLILFVLHPTSPTSAPEWRWRNRIYRAVIRYCQVQQDPILMLGDFNSTPWSPFFRDLMHESGLQQPGTRILPRPTWPAGWPLIGIPIDHFLLSPELAALSEYNGPNIGSDHYPIILEFVFRQE